MVKPENPAGWQLQPGGCDRAAGHVGVNNVKMDGFYWFTVIPKEIDTKK